ncbi:SPOR domain-containing protein [Rhodobacteraceae bacterium Araon29]|nr:sporulation protein [Marinovum sp.]|tara:strand:+ start:3522 stop:4442 length:921 start_codon:yes stop_codon:yes gene_type:complete
MVVYSRSEQSTPDPEGAEDSRALGSVANWIGALVSLALVIGVSLWAYRLVVRDVSGVPVIKASAEPMRVAPQNPGGTAALNQGLSVNQVVEAGDDTQPEFVTLAPRPVALGDDDIPTAQIEPVSTAVIAAPSRKAATVDIQTLADQIAVEVAPLNGELDTSEIVRLDSSSIENALKQALSEPQTSVEFVSLRPKKRPDRLQRDVAVPSGELAALRELAPDQIPVGTALVQLGAFASPEIARSEWRRLSGKFSSFMAGRELVIQRAVNGGRIFYRLRAAGFSDLSDARRFCSTLKAAETDCVPVVTR